MRVSNFIIGAAGAIIAWLTVEFVGRPFRRFFDLRGEVSRRLAQFDNVAHSSKMIDATRRETVPITDEGKARLIEAQNTFRDLASQMRGFAQSEPFAVGILSVFNYQPFAISTALFGLSNEIHNAGPMKEAFKRKIKQLLGIKDEPNESEIVDQQATGK